MPRSHLFTSPFGRRRTPTTPPTTTGPDDSCPGCRRSYDASKRRPVTDTCGHVRCRACTRDRKRVCQRCAVGVDRQAECRPTDLPAVDAGDRVRPQTSSPIVHVPALSAGFVPIDPARPPPAQQQQHPPAQQAPLRRRRLPDIPKEEEGGDGGSVSVTAVVLRQRSVDGRPPVRPDSGVGLADLGVAATGALYAANRGSCQSVQLHGAVQQTASPAVVSQRPSTALAGPTSRVSSSVTSSVSAVPARESRLRRSLRDDSRGSSRAVHVGGHSATAAVNGDAVRRPPCPLSAWSAAASRDRRRSADVDALVMAARQRAAAGDGVAVAGKEPGGSGTAGGGLSLSSTASNDTGYSSIDNCGERPGLGRAVNNGVVDVDVTSSCRSSSSCRDDVDDDVEQRPSVAELRQRFQTHSVSQPAELSKRCTGTFSPTPSTENDRERSRVALAVDDPLPPTAEVARCDLLAQLGVLLIADSQQTSSSSSSSRSAAVTGQPSGLPPPPRSTSSPGMLQPDDSVPCVDTSPNSTVPKDDSVDSETAASDVDKCRRSSGLMVTYNPSFTSNASPSLPAAAAGGLAVSTEHSVASLASSRSTSNSSFSPQSPCRRLPVPHTASPDGHQQPATSPQPLHRPHSVTASVYAVNNPGHMSKRGSSGRSSARGCAVLSPVSRTPHSSSSVHVAPVVRQQLHLTKINFEIFRREKTSVFVGREWLFRDMEAHLNATSGHCKGLLIIAGAGFGKTTIVEELVEFSSFGECRNNLVMEYLSDGTRGRHNGKGRPPLVAGLRTTNSGSLSNLSRPNISQSVTSLVSPLPVLTYDPLRRLSASVVAYHYCQVDNNITCTVPEFVHSLAAHLVCAPALAPYRDLLLARPRLHAVLGIRQCVLNASRAFVDGILQPLTELYSSGLIGGRSLYVIVVDALNEAAFHEPDYGDTIATFLARHLQLFPPCLRLVATTRTGSAEVGRLPLRELSVDGEMAVRDVADYVAYRAAVTPSIQANVEPAGRIGDPVSSHVKLAAHIATLSAGSMLYARLVLDMIERGPLVLKGSGYRVVPVNLAEVFQLEMNLRFATVRAFDRASSMLSVCLASLYPLTVDEIEDAVTSRRVRSGSTGLGEEMRRVLELVSGLLVHRRDGTYAFFHPTFREWLMRRDDTGKFHCDVRLGHALLALKMSRADAALQPQQVMELGHHILKAHIYKSIGTSASRQQLTEAASSRDLQAYWLCLSTDRLSDALVSHRNLFSPNVKVSRLLLLAGANPNELTESLNSAPALCIAAREGHVDLVSLYLEFGADVSACDDSHVPALSYTARRGRVNIIHLLTIQHAKINQVDREGWCPLVHAAANGHVEAVSFLLQCDWSQLRDKQPTRTEALQQALIAAARNGHFAVCEYLLGLQKIAGDGFSINATDSLFGETVLTAACLGGHNDTVAELLERGANVALPNMTGLYPLLCAATAGDWQVVETLLAVRQATSQLSYVDKNGRTALVVAAAAGHLAAIELLLSKGASLTDVDHEGLDAVSWAAIGGHLHCVELMLDRGCDIDHNDKIKRTALHLASFYGHKQVVQCLMDRGANVEHEDISGIRPLDRAISCHHTDVVGCFLRKGAKLGPSTWAMASGKPDIMVLLLNKLLDDGNVLYKKNRIRDAAYRYQYALKKLPVTGRENAGDCVSVDTYAELQVNLMLNLSRCKRKLNDLAGATELATQVLQLKPDSFEAYHARARAKRDGRQYQSAMSDLKEALSLASGHREIQRLLERVQDELEASHLDDNDGQTTKLPDSGVETNSRTLGIPDIVPGTDGNSFDGSEQNDKNAE